ncbi:helix-turn-helix transcriptional regulator [Candidatus Poribacteria bacterium]|nr:helix-turn-helix transcriptional regulator [Candidatus Poribacteria bacterium]
MNTPTLREARTLRGLSQACLAKRTGISQQTISQIERGNQPPAIDDAARLASAVGRGIHEIRWAAEPRWRRSRRRGAP